jgi:acetyl-CoA carboxylase biotin carboxylase subunit
MFKKILIANRGEIALRVIRTCKEMGIKTVVVYSTADNDSLPVRFADEAVCIGPPPSSESYLKIANIIAAAEITNADAIHPGYGFLSESPLLATACKKAGIIFIGPDAKCLKLFGDKDGAKQHAKKCGLNVLSTLWVPDNYTEPSLKKLVSEADLKFPVLLKALAGGGGRGMRLVNNQKDLKNMADSASREAKKFFGSGTIIIENYLNDIKHIEVQVACDKNGHAVHIFERECSAQRSYQKVIEEAPAANLTETLRNDILNSATKIFAKTGYIGLATVEFLVTADNEFYFTEVNPRLQVEHPVTELVTLTDIVKEQIWVASGRPLSISQEDVRFQGHAIEVRVNAEDPYTFVPSPGLVDGYHPPGGLGVRVDSAIYDRYKIPPFYDSLIAKIIVRGVNREEAIQKMIVALSECIIGGVTTNLPLLMKVLQNNDFASGKVHTKLLDVMFEEEKKKTAALLQANSK